MDIEGQFAVPVIPASLKTSKGLSVKLVSEKCSIKMQLLQGILIHAYNSSPWTEVGGLGYTVGSWSVWLECETLYQNPPKQTTANPDVLSVIWGNIKHYRSF